VKLRAALIGLGTLVLLASASARAPAAAAPACLEKGDGFRQISFRAADGARLHGITTGRGSLGLVLGHQLGSYDCEWYAMAKVFAARGYRALAIDFRGFGLSPTPRRANPTAFGADIGGAAAELRRLGARRVVAIGSSMGGTAVVVAGTKRAFRLAGSSPSRAPARSGASTPLRHRAASRSRLAFSSGDATSTSSPTPAPWRGGRRARTRRC
jgi:pimeloyl-ACP methyl ester carboxylesterase